ncbi:MAG: Tol biopolymer transport system component [Roseivirga sp.]|jgi:Tol biopolymer transport system component
MKQLTSLVFSICLFSLSALAQTSPPNSDIFVFDLKEKKGKISIDKGKNVTQRTGYDNQPTFYRDDYLLYSEYNNGQNDIMLLDLIDGVKKNVTNTQESEYSPVLVPGYDTFAAVRAEQDGSQRLWYFHLVGKTPPSVTFDNLAPVGYHAWSDDYVLMYILGSPSTLLLTDVKERNDKIITSNVGRTIKALPQTPNFVFERTEETGQINIYKVFRTGKFELIVKKPANASDWLVTQEGTFITSVGTKVLAFNPEYDSNWREVTDLGAMAKGGITRMAVNEANNKIALVIGQ